MNVEIYPFLPEMAQLMRLVFDTESDSFDYMEFGDQVMNAFGYMPTDHIKKYKEYEIDFQNYDTPSYIKCILDESMKLVSDLNTVKSCNIQFYYVQYDGDGGDGEDDDEDNKEEFSLVEGGSRKHIYMIDGISRTRDVKNSAYMRVEDSNDDHDDELYEFKENHVLITDDDVTFTYNKGEYRFIVISFYDKQ
jgi:hypothetical protein